MGHRSSRDQPKIMSSSSKEMKHCLISPNSKTQKMVTTMDKHITSCLCIRREAKHELKNPQTWSINYGGYNLYCAGFNLRAQKVAESKHDEKSAEMFGEWLNNKAILLLQEAFPIFKTHPLDSFDMAYWISTDPNLYLHPPIAFMTVNNCDIDRNTDAYNNISIWNVCVARDWRGLGLGTWFVRHVLKAHFGYFPYSRVTLTIENDNLVALHIYEKLGFHLVSAWGNPDMSFMERLCVPKDFSM